MLESVNNPTAMTASRIINESVTTKAKPGLGRQVSCGLLFWNKGVWIRDII